MAGRKSSKSRQISETSKTRLEKVKDPLISISPNGELRRRLDETAIDIKENIPAEVMPNRRVTRSCRTAAVGEPESSSPECRKRRSSQTGPSAKRPSNEKKKVTSDESSFSTCSESSSTSAKSRTRGLPLPVMEEEEDCLNSSADETKQEEHPIPDNNIVIYDEEEEDYEGVEDEDYGYDDEDEDEEEEDESNKPIENKNFASMSLQMNDVTIIKPPNAMDAAKLDGIGSPEKVWSLMVGRDEIARASHCLLNDHPDMTQTMRSLLIDWLMEVCESENLHRETFHLAVDYMDRYLESNDREINQQTFQLVGAASLFIAAKYEEIYPPRCEEFANLTDGAFNCANIRQMEILIVRAINWTLGPITSVHWLATYLQMLGDNSENVRDEHGDDHVLEANYFVPELMRDDFVHMAKILDYLLFEPDSLRFTYRTIAAAVLFACYEPIDVVENATGFKYDQLQPVIRFVEPVVSVFEKLRSPGDPMPANEKINADDVHNIQTYFKFDEYEAQINEERRHRPNIFD